MIRHLATRLGLAAAFGLLIGLAAMPAEAGVATSGAVLLDPFDPVPEIQFHHFGGYGCVQGCGGCDDCGWYAGYRSGCYDSCRPHYRHRARCDDDCDRGCRDHCRRGCEHDCTARCDGDCDRGCDHDCDRGCDHDCNSRCDHYCDRGCERDCRVVQEHVCQSARCYDSEHYERRWRDGDRVGQEWLDRGTRERTLPSNGSYGGYYRSEQGWRDDDDAPPPPPPPPPPDPHRR
jgi:hypothetical protein